MDAQRRRRPEAAGFRVGDHRDFPGLTPEEVQAVERSLRDEGGRPERGRKGVTMRIPTDIAEQLQRYVTDRVPPGSFLYAVLANDLYRAAVRADDRNRLCLADIARHVEADLPIACRGSPGAVERWLRRGEEARPVCPGCGAACDLIRGTPESRCCGVPPYGTGPHASGGGETP